MLEEEDTYNEYSEDLSNFNDDNEDDFIETEEDEVIDDYDYDFDNSMNDVDFSNASGSNFKRSFGRAKKQMGTKVSGVIVPDDRKVIIEGQGDKMFKSRPAPQRRKVATQQRRPQPKKRIIAKVTEQEQIVQRPRRKDRPEPRRSRPDLNVQVPVNDGVRTLKGKRRKKISDIIVPTDRPVIVKGASDFIVSQKNQNIKEIGYHKGKKLKELIFTFNNNSAVDFEMQIFNPSMPLDYLYSTSQNINDKITVAGGTVSYTDVLFNLLANPTLIHNSQFVFSGPNLTTQRSQALKVVNQGIVGKQKIVPLNLDVNIDTMQVASDIVYFNMTETLNRPFIPDGMDIITYKVLAGNTVTMCFYYEQVSLKKVFYKQARRKDIL